MRRATPKHRVNVQTGQKRTNEITLQQRAIGALVEHGKPGSEAEIEEKLSRGFGVAGENVLIGYRREGARSVPKSLQASGVGTRRVFQAPWQQSTSKTEKESESLTAEELNQRKTHRQPKTAKARTKSTIR